jgi:tocopherol cyclase
VPAERRRRDGLSAMHLAGALHVRVRRGGRTLFEGTSTLAGLERGLGPLSSGPGPGPPPDQRGAG